MTLPAVISPSAAVETLLKAVVRGTLFPPRSGIRRFRSLWETPLKRKKPVPFGTGVCQINMTARGVSDARQHTDQPVKPLAIRLDDAIQHWQPLRRRLPAHSLNENINADRSEHDQVKRNSRPGKIRELYI